MEHIANCFELLMWFVLARRPMGYPKEIYFPRQMARWKSRQKGGNLELKNLPQGLLAANSTFLNLKDFASF